MIRDFFLKESCGHINVNCVFARSLMRGIDIVKKNRYKTARKMLDDFAKIKNFLDKNFKCIKENNIAHELINN